MSNTGRIACVLMVAASFFPIPASAQAPDANAMVRKMDLALYPPSYVSVMTMKTVKPSGESASMVFEISYRHGVGSRMEITAPSRSKGIRLLQKGDSLWLFNPRSGSRRAIRLSARDSFQGSAFSNNDVSDTEFSGKYNAAVIRSESLRVEESSRQCVVIEALAGSRSSPYARVLMWMDEANNIPYRMDYFAHSGLLFKRLTLSRFRDIAGRERPTAYHMESFDQPGLSTDVSIDSLEARDDLPDRIFTQADLTQ